jgi:hypothetical protein
MINLFGAPAQPGYKVPVGGSTRTTSVGGGAGLFGLWPQPQYRTNCLPPVDLRATTTITTTTAAPASSGFFAAPQPTYRDCSKKTLVDLDARKADDDGKPSKATNKASK